VNNDGSRTKLLLGILGVLVLFVVWNYIGPSGGGDAGGGDDDLGNMTLPMNRPRVQTETKPPVEEIVDLKVADLQPEQHEYRVGRDPWRFAEPPPPPPPPPAPPPRQPTQEELEAQRRAEEELRRQQEEAARLAAIEAARPKPPQFALKCIGKFGPTERPIAVFIGPDGKTILNVRQGGTIEGKFILSQVGYESVEIRYVDFPNEPPLRLPIGRS
jgi:hypothetical protein